MSTLSARTTQSTSSGKGDATLFLSVLRVSSIECLEVTSSVKDTHTQSVHGWQWLSTTSEIE